MKASAVHTQTALHQHQLFETVGMGWCNGGCVNQVASLFQQIPPPTVFSEPESDLTCHLSATRKRPREEPPMMPPSSYVVQNHHQQQKFLWQKQLTRDVLSVGTTRPDQSALASTSGRPPLSAYHPSPATQASERTDINTAPRSSSSSGLVSMLHNHQTLEIDALVRLHAEKLRSQLHEASKRQCRAALAAMEQRAQRRVAEKQAELEAAATRNAELQGRLRQVTAESQAWFNVARNSEALVAALRASLEHAILHNLAACNNNANDGANSDPSRPTGVLHPGADTAEDPQEGYGDSEEEATAASATVSFSARCGEVPSSVDAAARDEPSAATGRSLPCKSCGDHDACVLLFPCRHLCLCTSCEPTVAECPLCRTRKNAALNINLS